jgi:hypothetical protein
VPHPCGFQGAGFDFNSGLERLPAAENRNDPLALILS